MRAFFAARAALWNSWAPALRAACPELDLAREGDPAGFDAVIYAPGFPKDGRAMDFAPFTRARLVQSLWAGVERIAPNPTLIQPLCRMVDPGLAQGMVEYCAGWTLRAHLGMDRFAQDGLWRNDCPPPLAAQRRVSVLGMGELGGAVADALAALGFRVTGWSASGRPRPGIEVLGGPDLHRALGRADILVTLLPDTPATRDLLDADRLALLPQGAWIINPGRGTLIVEDDLLAALNSGRLSHAVLDVFRTEPLPPAHPFWSHPQITVTPHVAAETRPASAAPVVAENLRRAMAGRPLLHQVDRARGY
ncbi:2-hydroxyacid dehydrogenase [Paracoccus contaminans]|uniref:Glyoxylate/hydroxypyruvate reductase A n=1 Tax=Paracoccus contaminans TaxID=1945662 RepID=A0A1W6CU61_9RHOB|nr:glyoxylate/hydroxypyruvate reductase A [Paracoccus contaminans]ARJ68422.1 glyoxylate/hydroxypyruvate reductase A [Paracoccus contaminans]